MNKRVSEEIWFTYEYHSTLHITPLMNATQKTALCSFYQLKNWAQRIEMTRPQFFWNRLSWFAQLIIITEIN